MKNIKIPLLVSFALIIFCNLTKAQTDLSIIELNKKLGRGVNMGNMFEAPSEGEWGNPFKDDYFKKIADLGFNHVRIPMRWDVAARALQSEPYTVNAVFLQRVKYVIDLAKAQKLYVVLNMHHHEELFSNPEKAKPRFLSQWAQIAEYFKGYDQGLLFEIMNEPHDKLTPELWNTFNTDAIKEIRKTNPTRGIVTGPGEYNSVGALPKLKLPEDKNLIVSIHYYNPFTFTHQGAEWIGGDANKWLGTKWEDLALERKQVESEFEYLITWAKEKNLPIHIGEFGAYEKADLDSRNKWTNFLARWFEQKGFSWAYWEFSAGFGIYNPATSTFKTSLVDALLKNPMANPKVLPTKLLYKSAFESGSDGFSLAVQPAATASLVSTVGKITIDVKTASKDGWFVQLNKTNIPLVNKKRYLVTIVGLADKEVGVTNYLGKNASPYNSYSGYSSVTFTTKEKEFSYTFLMNDPTDNAARLTFDMGTTIAKIDITSIKIEEVLEKPEDPIIITPLANEPLFGKEIEISPNPNTGFIFVKNIAGVESIIIANTKGQTTKSIVLKSQSEIKIDIGDMQAGPYFLKFEKKGEVVIRKVIKF